MSVNSVFEFLKWGYGPNNGPHAWGQMFPIAECGDHQSPIAIEDSECQDDPALKPVNTNYNLNVQLKLENTGVSWQLHLLPELTSLTGGPLQGQFQAVQIHAHWGAEAGRGSEHVINGKQYDAEIHIVHYNTKYLNAADAFDKSDGLAVLGILVQTGKHNDQLDKLIRHLCEIRKSGSSTFLMDGFDPNLLLPSNGSYYTYPGSLTTPPLFESVTWTVFGSPIEASSEQLNEMRSLMCGCKSKRIVDNFRPPAQIKQRVVRRFRS